MDEFCPGQIDKVYTETPRALVGADGLPNKGRKSSTTTYLAKQYSDVPLVTQNIGSWKPHSVIIDGMVLLHTNPLAHHHTMTDYANMLVNKFIAPYYKAGAMEVHVVFDDPDRHRISPKTIERLCRDGQGPQTLGHGQHSLSLPTLPHYSQWQNVLKCHQCKRSITESLASSLLTVASQHLPTFGKFVTAGAFTGTNQDKCLSVYAGCPEWKEEPTLQCNAEEADTRVWLHCKYSAGCSKIVFSQDTDTYHIGMGLLTDCRLSELDIYVQLQWSHVSKATNRFVHLSALQEALINDPDLAHLPNDILLPCLQILYVVSGLG